MSDAQDTKPARYRSQRKAPVSSPTTAADAGLGRSRSRYHHNRPTAPESVLPSTSRSTRATHQDAQAEDESADDKTRPRSTNSNNKTLDKIKSKSPTRIDQSQFIGAPRQIRAKAEAFVPEQQEGDVLADEPSGCFGFFAKKKKNLAVTNKPVGLRPVIPGPQVIRPGGGGIVPMVDAPLSAQNVGARRVTVECNGRSIILFVSPTTSATDLIASAADSLTESIDLRTSVLLENFHAVGITRPLRRYEHVKDVMNSWDDDFVNTLQIVPARAIDASPASLSAANVPREKPRESSFLMLYSQKPGTWDKRLITIRQDGQVVMSKPNKDTEATNICHLTDFDIYNPTARQLSKKIKPPKKMCYAIKSQQRSSMFLKSSTYVHFFSTSDRTLASSFYDAVQSWRSWYLVHVLEEGKTTSHQSTELRRSASKATRQSKQSSTASTDVHHQTGTYKPLIDLEQPNTPNSSHAQDMSFSASSNIPTRKPSTRDRSSHAAPFLKQQQLGDDEPLVNLVGNRGTLRDHDTSDSEAFGGEGLLGRSYSTRQKVVADREAAAQNASITGPSLLSGNQAAGLERQTSIKRTASNRRAANGTDLRHRPSTRERVLLADDGLKRSSSTRAKEISRPLVDLTPGYVPPPQHHKKGKGYHPDQIGPGGLIDNATSPDQAYFIPPAQDWRAGRTNVPAVTGAGVSRQTSLAHRPAPETTDEAFTGTGLLSEARGGYTGKASVGRGVMSGNRNAREPMLDVSEQGKYAPGSLLNKVARTEREEGRGGPIIDRGR